MSSITWSWKEHWLWFEQLQTDQKRQQWMELMKDEWLEGLPMELQFDVLKDAPDEILYALKHLPYIKREAIRKISKYIEKKGR